MTTQKKRAVSADSTVSSSSSSSSSSSVASSNTKKMKWTNILIEPEPPMSAYNLFFQEERSRLLGLGKCTLILRRSKTKKKQSSTSIPHGLITFQDLSKHVAKTWNNLSKEGKSKYNNLYRETKKQYDEEMIAYHEAVQNAIQRVHAKKKKEAEEKEEQKKEETAQIVKQTESISTVNEDDLMKVEEEQDKEHGQTKQDTSNMKEMSVVSTRHKKKKKEGTLKNIVPEQISSSSSRTTTTSMRKKMIIADAMKKKKEHEVSFGLKGMHYQHSSSMMYGTNKRNIVEENDVFYYKSLPDSHSVSTSSINWNTSPKRRYNHYHGNDLWSASSSSYNSVQFDDIMMNEKQQTSLNIFKCSSSSCKLLLMETEQQKKQKQQQQQQVATNKKVCKASGLFFTDVVAEETKWKNNYPKPYFPIKEEEEASLISSSSYDFREELKSTLRQASVVNNYPIPYFPSDTFHEVSMNSIDAYDDNSDDDDDDDQRSICLTSITKHMDEHMMVDDCHDESCIEPMNLNEILLQSTTTL